MSNEPLLSFDTAEPERQHILIDGQAYELSAPSDLSLRSKLSLNAFWREWTSYMADESERDAQELMARLDNLLPIIVRGCPQEVLARLNEGQKHDLVMAFLYTLGTLSREIYQAIVGLWTSVDSSQRSNGTTAAAPATGSDSRSGG